MPTPIISVEDLSKLYLIGHRAERGGYHNYTALRDVIGRELRNVVRKASDVVRGRQVVQGDAIEEFWALKDISFDVAEGEVLGIIGRNGAGKSTLLKILSRITEPTKGRITLRGRVASLLEVGTGFHPELTGRENIYLNGAILGMTRAEIRKRFDEIVAFAEIETFLDTPVKRFSSGMYVRLAFSVAAHLEPEILIVDEVLAVGDAEFQKKCLTKMDEVSRQGGRTVLFVSHNLSAIGQLAGRAVLLKNGSISADAPVNEALASYLSSDVAEPVYVSTRPAGDPSPHVNRVEVVTSNRGGIHQHDNPFDVRICVRHKQRLERGCFSFQILNQYQQPVIHAFACYPDIKFGFSGSQSQLLCKFPNLRLNVGHYYLRTHLSEPPGGRHYETLDGICPFEVVRFDRGHPWGWRPEACVYHEECVWEHVGAIADELAL